MTNNEQDGRAVTQSGGIELVRCTRGHTVKKGSCTAIIGELICPVCECRIPGHTPETAIDAGDSDGA